jgi:RNA polymerase sigma factor (sigma-70 family)
MPSKPEAPPDSFDDLLNWLDPDRERAGQLYEEIRSELIKIFGWGRCVDPEGMTDEVFDRVTRKIVDLRKTYEGNPKLFFFGVANNMIKEYQKTIPSRVSIEDVDPPAAPDETTDSEEESDRMIECLQECLTRVRRDKRELLMAYYAKEKQAKINQRAAMARRLGISIETLRVQMYRIRADLEKCIARCLAAREKA